MFSVLQLLNILCIIFLDQTSTISKSHGAELALNKEARKWTTKLAKEQKVICKKTRELKKLQMSANADTNVRILEPVKSLILLRSSKWHKKMIHLFKNVLESHKKIYMKTLYPLLNKFCVPV